MVSDKTIQKAFRVLSKQNPLEISPQIYFHYLPKLYIGSSPNKRHNNLKSLPIYLLS